MAPQIVLTGTAPDDEEAAAAIGALLAVLADEAAGEPAPAQIATSQWHASARLLTQGLQPARLPVAPDWGRIERLRRAGRGGRGIVGQ
jgi:hypothetical protein